MKIEDLDQVEAWLKTQNERVNQAFAARAALRALPAAMSVVNQVTKRETEGHFLLACFRASLAALTSSVYNSGAAHEILEATHAAASSSFTIRSDAEAARSAAHASRCAALSLPIPAIKANIDAAKHLARSSFPNSARGYNARTARLEALVRVVKTAFEELNFMSESTASAFTSQPIWLNLEATTDLNAEWQKFSEISDPKHIWSFWRRWYRGVLEGTPMDWDLQLQVALIDDAAWESGPESVASEIMRIEAKWELEREVASLKEQLAEAKQLASLPIRLHNQPPEAIDDTNALFQTDISLVWDTLVELEEEIEKPEPSPSRLKKNRRGLAWICEETHVLLRRAWGHNGEESGGRDWNDRHEMGNPRNCCFYHSRERRCAIGGQSHLGVCQDLASGITPG